MPDSLTYRRVPRIGYAWTVAGILIGLAGVVLVLRIWQATLPMVEHFYLWKYLRYAVQSALPYPGRAFNKSAALCAFLRHQVFEDRTAFEVFEMPILVSGVVLILSLFSGIGLDQRRLNAFRRGKRLRGWEVLTPRQFNRTTKGADGFVLDLEKR